MFDFREFLDEIVDSCKEFNNQKIEATNVALAVYDVCTCHRSLNLLKWSFHICNQEFALMEDCFISFISKKVQTIVQTPRISSNCQHILVRCCEYMMVSKSNVFSLQDGQFCVSSFSATKPILLISCYCQFISIEKSQKSFVVVFFLSPFWAALKSCKKYVQRQKRLQNLTPA